MIEGIVGLFVIVGLMLVVPCIVDWYKRTHNPEDIVKITITQDRWIQTRRDGTEIHHMNEDRPPKEGDLWLW